MIRKCSAMGGNLLLNIGPKADGSVPAEAIEPLQKVGSWLSQNGEAAYGKKTKVPGWTCGANNVSHCTASQDGKTVYVWNYIWPSSGTMVYGGYRNAPKKITLLATGENVDFEKDGHRLILKNLPKENPDKIMGIPVVKMEFDEPFDYCYGSYYPQVYDGVDHSEGIGN